MMQAAHATKITKLFYRLAITCVPFAVVLFTVIAFQSKDPEYGIPDHLINSSLLLPFLVLNLAFINWFTEAWKWKYMLRNFVKISWSESYRAVLTGISLGFITPARVGDLWGKNLFLEKTDKMKGITTAVISSVIQSLVTLIAGITGLIFLSGEILPELNPASSAWMIIIASVTGLISMAFFYSPARILYPFSKVKFLKTPVRIINESMTHYTRKQLFHFFLISFLRYLVFTLQFLLLLHWAGINGSNQVLVAEIAVVFFLSSFVPSFFLGKLGIRETFAVLLIGVPASQCAEVITASLLLWLINQVLPAVIGSFLILSLRTKEEI